MVTRHRTGEVSFTVPRTGQSSKTWYRISGALNSDTIPLILLHGGPGACSDYMWTLEKLTEAYGITTVSYDQIGNGRSTHFPETKGDTDFWTEDLFIAEFENLLKELGITGQYDILGQSWGGMMGAQYAISQPANLRRLIISNSPADMRLWIEACDKLRAALPPAVQDALTKHERDGTTDSEEYEAAVLEFYKRYLCRLWPFPQPVQDALDWIARDPTTYRTMNGPSEFYVTGRLKNWSLLGKLGAVRAKTLVINAEFDEAQDSTCKPFVDEIPGAVFKCFEGASHMTQFEKPEEYIKLVGEFLKS